MELKGDPGGSHPGLLKRKGQKSIGNQRWWVDEAASWDADHMGSAKQCQFQARLRAGLEPLAAAPEIRAVL